MTQIRHHFEVNGWQNSATERMFLGMEQQSAVGISEELHLADPDPDCWCDDDSVFPPRRGASTVGQTPTGDTYEITAYSPGRVSLALRVNHPALTDGA